MIPKGGRVERRLSVTVHARMASLDRPWLAELAMTENVSPFGARTLVKDAWKPGERVIVESLGGVSSCEAHVVYCELLKTGTTAVGLRLARPRLDWMSRRRRIG